MPPRKRKAKTEPADSPPSKRTSAPRAAKVDRNDPNWLVTNENSPLANEDLHAEFADPKAYEGFTKEDWDDIRETLPPDVPINPDGYSIPIDFFKYNPDFRRGIREFQEDLSSGRLEPEWQAAAAKAMEERASGNYDAYKEDHFEEFWGQKQKLSYRALAGDSAKLKLDVLIKNGIFRLGDYFSYSRGVGYGDAKILIEKDCKIVNIDGETMTFAIPPGQSKYARHLPRQESKSDSKTTLDLPKVNEDGSPYPTPSTEINGGEPPADAELADGGDILVDTESREEKATTYTEKHGSEPPQPATNIQDNTTSADPEYNGHDTWTDTKNEEDNTLVSRDIAGNETSASFPEASEDPEEDVILHTIRILKHLEDKIVDIDGRFKGTGARSSVNTWKALRCKRNNQDLGSLFEMREEFYVWKHPQIVKTPQKKKR